MASYQKITIIGNLGKDPETRQVGQTSVTNFNVAVNEKGRGGAADTTLWFRVACWAKLGEVAAQYLKKGSGVYVEGPLSVREYDGQNGRAFSLEVNARELKFIGGAGDGAGSAAAAGNTVKPTDDYDDPLPF